MPTLLNTQFKTVVADSFIDLLTSDNLYMFIGKITEWDNEASPDAITNSVTDLTEVLNNIFAIKRINESDACLVVPRIDWTTGTIYDQYDPDDSDLFNSDFYVLSSDMNVYKCISNADGSQSTAEPTGQSTTEVITSDGYIWKFLYNLSSSIQVDFLTDDYLPVPTGNKKTAQQILVENAATYETDSPAGGHGKNASFELGASKMIVLQKFEGTEEGVIDASNKYREVGIIKDVKLLSGLDATGSVYSVGDTNSTIDITTGQILYVESNTPIQRNESQTETIKVVIDFNQ